MSARVQRDRAVDEIGVRVRVGSKVTTVPRMVNNAKPHTMPRECAATSNE